MTLSVFLAAACDTSPEKDPEPPKIVHAGEQTTSIVTITYPEADESTDTSCDLDSVDSCIPPPLTVCDFRSADSIAIVESDGQGQILTKEEDCKSSIDATLPVYRKKFKTIAVAAGSELSYNLDIFGAAVPGCDIVGHFPEKTYLVQLHRIESNFLIIGCIEISLNSELLSSSSKLLHGQEIQLPTTFESLSQELSLVLEDNHPICGDMSAQKRETDAYFTRYNQLLMCPDGAPPSGTVGGETMDDEQGDSDLDSE